MIINPGFDQAATRYLDSLTHLHSANSHDLPVCRICRGPTGVNHVGEHWELCRPCQGHLNDAGINAQELADATGFIIYALKHADGSADQALRDMYRYKLTHGRATRQEISEEGQRIRVLLYVTLRDNLADVLTASAPIDMITHVPSTSTHPGRDPYALGDALSSAISKLRGAPPHVDLLTPGAHKPAPSRTVDPDRFSVRDPGMVAGRHVLLVEDTWVTGASAQSAAVTLHRAGTTRVTVLCIARMLTAQWQAGHYLTSQYTTFPPPSSGIPVF